MQQFCAEAMFRNSAAAILVGLQASPRQAPLVTTVLHRDNFDMKEASSGAGTTLTAAGIVSQEKSEDVLAQSYARPRDQ